jgi:hypothetical protein
VDDKYERLGIRVTSIGEPPYLDPGVAGDGVAFTKEPASNGVHYNGVHTNGETNGVANGNGHANGD